MVGSFLCLPGLASSIPNPASVFGPHMTRVAFLHAAVDDRRYPTGGLVEVIRALKSVEMRKVVIHGPIHGNTLVLWGAVLTQTDPVRRAQ